MRGELFTEPVVEARRVSGASKREVEPYTALPYHLVVVRDGEDKSKPWTVSVEELPGCMTRGRTSDEALAAIEPAMAKWVAVALEEGREIPEPRSATTHSGRLLLRMPRTLHADLTRASEREGVSLNQFITDVLAAAVAWRGRPDAARSGAATTPINQAPGAEGLTAEPAARRRGARSPTRFTNAALLANLLIVGAAGIVAIIVLIAAVT